MNHAVSMRLLFVVACALGLAACGQTGPLVAPPADPGSTVTADDIPQDDPMVEETHD